VRVLCGKPSMAFIQEAETGVNIRI